MSWLTDAELAAIRADIANLLPDTCNLLTVTETSDGQGGFTQSWGTATASVACRLDPVTFQGREVLAGGAVQAYHTFYLTLPYDTTITEKYRVSHGGNTYGVKSVDRGKSWAAAVRCVVEKL